MSNEEIVAIPFKEKTIQLHFTQFDHHINVDELCKIDYSNLYAELITIPALMNRVGMWKAEADNAVAEARLARDIKEAEVAKIINSSKEKSLTGPQMIHALTLDPQVQNMRRIRIRRGKEAGYLDSLYWAVKAKEKKLDKIGERMNLSPEEFEKNLVEGNWNGILIKSRQNLMR